MAEKIGIRELKNHTSRIVQIEEEIEEMRLLAQEVAAAWVSPNSGVELVEEQRR